jgi:hypothetical protein
MIVSGIVLEIRYDKFSSSSSSASYSNKICAILFYAMSRESEKGVKNMKIELKCDGEKLEVTKK